MKREDILSIVAVVAILAGIAGYFAGYYQFFSPIPRPGPMPDPALTSGIECTSDADCPSARYTCEATLGTGTACSSGDPSCVPASAIVEGICKLKEGSRCQANFDCAIGLLCHKSQCISPGGQDCSGPADTSCPADYECVRNCGSPVGYPGEPDPGYSCRLKGYPLFCPICLASNTEISTPSGEINVKDVRVGMQVWSLNEKGERVDSAVVRVTKTSVPSTHKVVHLILSDGRKVWVSPGHPAAEGKTVRELTTGAIYDSARIRSAELVPYWDAATYDILPDTAGGLYWANGILLKSTLLP